jgi:hypothetical protein
LQRIRLRAPAAGRRFSGVGQHFHDAPAGAVRSRPTLLMKRMTMNLDRYRRVLPDGPLAQSEIGMPNKRGARGGEKFEEATHGVVAGGCDRHVLHSCVSMPSMPIQLPETGTDRSEIIGSAKAGHSPPEPVRSGLLIDPMPHNDHLDVAQFHAVAADLAEAARARRAAGTQRERQSQWARICGERPITPTRIK